MRNMITKNFLRNSVVLLSFALFAISCNNDDDFIEIIQPVEKVTLFAGNNSNGNLSVFNFAAGQNTDSKTLITTSTAADGIYFDTANGFVYHVSRSANKLEAFANVNGIASGASIATAFSSNADMTSPREVAVSGNMFVVADNSYADGNPATADGRLFVYTMNNASFTLRNIVTTNFKLWGIVFKGNDLFAVADTTNQLAVFTNFLATTTTITLNATKKIAIEGLARTHGITYDADSDTMILTDIGSATNTSDDGGLHIINSFTGKFNAVSNGGMLTIAGNQVRISGSNTLMGNPVDVAYDSKNKMIYVAEAGNGGGRILGFSNTSAGGNTAPAYNSALASASSVYLSK